MPFTRFDRLATLYFFHPTVRVLPLHNAMHIPILMYHSISEKNEAPEHPYYWTHTSPKIFNQQMEFLHRNQYRVISLHEAVQQIQSGTSASGKCVVITFDDGYRDFFTSAFPILQKYYFTATVFLSTGYIDHPTPFKEKDCLTWPEIRELWKHGVSFGSHTVSHPELRFLKRNEVEYELRQSKETIEDQIGESVESFSYPFAFPEEDKEFKAFLRHTLEACGYRSGVSTRIGTARRKEDIYFLKRIPVNSADDLSFFRAKLEGGYDWLHASQYLFKLAKKKASARGRATGEGGGYAA